jgi:hypothetical protein
MHALRAAYHVAKANLRVRLRDRRLLVVVAGCVYLGHLVVAGDIELALADQSYRGVENAAWMGTLTSLTASMVVALFGFYLVRGALARDRQARLGPLIASSPVGSLAYLLGTWAGSALFLLGLVGVMAASGAVLVVLRGHGVPRPGPLLVPFLLFSGPVAAVTAALALAFECVPGLGGRVGGVLYFVLALGALILPIATALPMDLLGLTTLHESMVEALLAQHPEATPGDMFAFGYFEDVGTLTPFRWDGVAVTAGLIGERLGLVLASVGLVAGAGLFFRRFDPSPEGWARRMRAIGSGDPDDAAPPSGETDSIPGVAVPSPDPSAPPDAPDSAARPSLGTLPGRRTLRPLRLIWAELKLALGGQSRLWKLGAIGIAVAGFVAPSSAGVLILAWLWPMPLWAALGTRPAVHQTTPLLATTLYPRARRGAAWAAGALVGLGLTLGPLLLGGNGGVLVGVLFVPALALAAGRLAGTPRLFEITFLVLWYLGPANRQAALDFGGVTTAPPATQIGFLGAAILFLGGSVVRR